MATYNIFEGSLVKLTSKRAGDEAHMALWQQDGDYLRRLDTSYAVPRSEESIAEFDRNEESSSDSVSFRLRTASNDDLIGFAVLHGIEWNNQSCLIAIGIGDPSFRGKGYGAEALYLLLRYAFDELNMNRVGLDVISNNTPAIKAYKRAGFMEEGRKRQAVLRDGQQFDLILMGVLRTEWREKHQSEK